MDLKREFQTGAESARIRSRRAALLRALQVGIPGGIALGTPTAWWKKILIFLVLMFLVGFVVQFREIRRARRTHSSAKSSATQL